MRKQLLFLKTFALTTAMSLVSMGLFADNLKPYPVHFSFGDNPEFKTKGWRNPAASGTALADDAIQGISWHSGVDEKPYQNCATLAYRVNIDKIQNVYPPRAAYGDYFSLACSYNRAMRITFTLPWLNPGQYRVYMNVFSAQGGGNAYRGCAFASTVFDADTVKIDVPHWIINADGQRTIGGNSNGAGIAVGSYKGGYDSVFINPIKSNVVHTNTAFYCGQVVVKEAGIHTFTVNINGKDGVELGFDMISLIPVTATDKKEDYEYPKFDVGGNIYLDADYPYANYTGGNNIYNVAEYDSLSLSKLIVDELGVSMGVLPFQVTDPSTYDNMVTVTLDAGRFFKGKNIVLLRAADRWTRMFTGKVGEDGTVQATVPAGEYYCEVDNTDYAGLLTVSTNNATLEVGTKTAEVVFLYNADEWYVDNSFKIYSEDGTKLYVDTKIKEDGTLEAIELPFGKYYYRVGESEDKATYFDEGTIEIASTDKQTFDNRTPVYDVTIKAGADEWIINESVKIYRSSNAAAIYADDLFDEKGELAVKLPAGVYTIETDNRFLFNEFEVKESALTLDYAGRYDVEIYTGNIMNGYEVAVYKYYGDDFMSDAILVGTETIANGKAVVSGLSNGSYRHSVLKTNGEEVEVINPYVAFEVKNAKAVVGDPEAKDGPYMVPKAVFFDPLQQPEINWRTDAGRAFTNDGTNDYGLSLVSLPVMPVYTYKKDTTWLENGEYTVAEDKSVITNTTYHDAFKYTWSGTATESKNAYVNGDYAEIRLNATNCPDGVSISFTTPIINKGRYNIYMANRGNGDKNKPMLDTIFVDGKPTSLQNVSLCFYTPQDASSTDNTRFNLNRTPYRRSVSLSSSGNWGNIIDVYLGWIDIETTGRHTLTLKSMRCGSYYLSETPVEGSYNEQISENEYRVFPMAINPFWADLIKFIPVGEDKAPQGGEYYPHFDVCGFPTYQTSGGGKNDLGIEGVNHIFAPWQQPELSVYKNDNADYTTKFSLTSGEFGAADQISFRSVIDNWTHYEYVADSTSGDIVSMPVIPGVFNWQTLNEGIVGKNQIDLTKDNSLTIPATLASKIKGDYQFLPSEDDPEVGTVLLTAYVEVDGDYDFTYPVTGPVVFNEFGSLLKQDTLYANAKGVIRYELPDYNLADIDQSAEDQFSAVFLGNGKRLQGVEDASNFVSVKAIAQAEGISVYPNPVIDVLSIRLDGVNGKANYRLYNQAGQQMKAGAVQHNQADIDLNDAAAGLYFLQVEVDGKRAVYKVVK